MNTNSFLVISSFIIQTFFVKSSQTVYNNEFLSVSTSKPDVETLADLLSRIETRIEYSQTLKENNRRLQALELQNTNFNTHLQNSLNTLNLQLASIQQSLEKSTISKSSTHSKTLPSDCQEVKERGNIVSGMYLIQPKYSSESFMVLCDMETRSGGWAYFLNRFDGSENFYLNWTEYKKGFGSLSGEFWLGLEALHQLTGFEANELLVVLDDFDGNSVYALYNSFVIGSEDEGYPMKVLGSYSGNAGDSLRQHAGMKFTTLDRDQDLRPQGNCANYEKGSWWYRMCTTSNLTAQYLKGNVTAADRWQIMYWEYFRGDSYSLKKARMMVRPRGKHSSSVLP